MIALLAGGVSGAWADVVVTISDQSDLAGITDASSSEATATHKYGVYSGSDAANTPYYTTFTTNETSGLAGVTLSTTAKIIKPTHVGGTNVAHYGHLLAINYDKADATVYTFTLKAPEGYYIKSYTMTALSTSDGAPFEIQFLDGSSAYTAKGYLYKETRTVKACSTTAGFTIQRKSNNNANYLCIPTLTVTLATTPTYAGYDTSININNTTGNLSHKYNPSSTSTWFDYWESTSSPTGLSLYSSPDWEHNNMQQDASKINIHSAYSPTYTITAPAGYLIAGYKICVYAGAAGSRLTPSGYGTAILSTDSSDPTYVYVQNVNAKAATFTRTGTSTDGNATTFTVYLKEAVQITYVVNNSGGTEIFRSSAVDTWPGVAITTLPSQYRRDFCTYNEIDETADASKTVEFTATWDGPFEISASYASAHWYDMSVRSTWYVTSDNVEDGALKTVNANALGLVTEPYQWAFVGNPYNLKLYNKDKGEDYVYAWTSAANNNKPTFVTAATGNTWTIKASTAGGYSDAFMLTIPDYGYQLNQHNGEGGPLWIWNSTVTTDAGSAFKVFDVPTDFSEYVTTEIAPYMENEAIYFNWTDDARATIGYNASYKTSCTYANYSSMKTALTSALADLNDKVNYPPTGYYRLLNRQHSTKYLGQEGDLAAFIDATKANTIVKLTKHPSSNTYTFQIQGKYIQEPDGEAAGGYQVETGNDQIWFTPTVQTIGYASFAAGSSDYNNIHCSGSSTILGWDSSSNASHWTIEDASTANVTFNSDGAGTPTYYATLCLPFDATISGADAYTLEDKTSYLVPTAVTDNKVPAGTPVLLKGDAATATATINTGAAFNSGSPLECALTGTYVNKTIDGSVDYVLGIDSGVVGFYHWNQNTLGANKAYLKKTSPVKGYTVNWDNVDVVTSVEAVQPAENAIYNLAGLRLKTLQKGVNLVNGKAIIVK